MNNIDSVTFHDANGEELNIGDNVIFLGQKGTVTFECGAYGIGFKDGVNWYPIEERYVQPVRLFYRPVPHI